MDVADQLGSTSQHDQVLLPADTEHRGLGIGLESFPKELIRSRTIGIITDLCSVTRIEQNMH